MIPALLAPWLAMAILSGEPQPGFAPALEHPRGDGREECDSEDVRQLLEPFRRALVDVVAGLDEKRLWWRGEGSDVV